MSGDSANLVRAEDDLFNRWREHRKRLSSSTSFTTDGAMPDFMEQHCRLLFVAKEANGYDGDLREAWNWGLDRKQTWFEIARWTLAFLDGNLDLPNEEGMKQAIRRISWLNLKKCPGSHTARERAIRIAATQDRDFIIEQVKLYRPSVTICVGPPTFSIMQTLLGGDMEYLCTYKNGDEQYYVRTAEAGAVLDFWHPSRKGTERLNQMVLNLRVAATQLKRVANTNF